MKSPHEPFDDELRERLQQYTEEPSENLWQGIASQISSVNHEPNWVGWSQRISGAVIVGVMIMVGVLQFGIKEISTDMFVTSIHQLETTQNKAEEGKSSNHQNKNEKTVSENHDISNDNRSEREIKSIHSTKELREEKPLPVSLDKAVSPKASEPYLELKVEEKLIVEEKGANQLFILQAYDIKQEPSASSEIKKDTLKPVLQPETKLDSVTASEKEVKSIKKRGKRQRKYTLYFTAMPTFGYQRVESNQNDNIIIESINKIPAFSTDRLGVRAELGAEFHFCKNKKFKMFGGFLYYQRKQTIGYTEKQLDSTLVTSGPNGEINIEPQFSYVEKSIEYELRNVGVQLGINYRLSRKKPGSLDSKKALSSKTIPFPVSKLLHVIGTGIEFHKALNKTNEFNQANGFTNPSAYVFCNFYYRLQYPSEGRLRAIFQPTLNYSFYINENLNAPFYVKPYGLGLNFGCSYNF